MYHNFFIHSSVNGHLHCFHVLAIINSPAMKTVIHVPFSILVFSRYSEHSNKILIPQALERKMLLSFLLLRLYVFNKEHVLTAC